jgi:PAP_fibrillin
VDHLFNARFTMAHDVTADLITTCTAFDPASGPSPEQVARIRAAAEAIAGNSPPPDLLTAQNQQRLTGLWRTLFTTHGVERGYATLDRMTWGQAPAVPMRTQMVQQLLDPSRGSYRNIVTFRLDAGGMDGIAYTRGTVSIDPATPDTFRVSFHETEYQPASNTPWQPFMDQVSLNGSAVYAAPSFPPFASPVAYLDDRLRFMRGSDDHLYILLKVA